MIKEHIQIRILEPMPQFRDVIHPIAMFPPIIGARHATNAINPPEVRELVLVEIPRDEILGIIKK